MYGRLADLRRDSLKGIGRLAWASCLPLFFVIWGLIHSLGSFLVVTIISSSGKSMDSSMMLEVLGSMALSIVITIGGVLFLIWLGRGAFKRWHAEVWYELHTTNLAVLVVDDAYTRLLTDRIADTWSLRWFAPPPPKTLEEQLEFSASFYVSLRKLLWGVGRLESSPLWQGGMAWFAGTMRGMACGCLIFMFLSLPGAAIWILGGMAYLRRCASLVAICDFMLIDDRQSPAAEQVNVTEKK